MIKLFEKKHWFILLNWPQIEMQHSHRKRMIREIIFLLYNLQTYENSFTSMFLTNSINRNVSCLTQLISLFSPLRLKIQLPNKMLTFIRPSKWSWSSFSKCSESPEYTQKQGLYAVQIQKVPCPNNMGASGRGQWNMGPRYSISSCFDKPGHWFLSTTLNLVCCVF